MIKIRKNNGFILFAFLIILVFINLFLYSIFNNISIFYIFIKNYSKNVENKKSIYDVLEYAINDISNDKNFLFDFKGKKLFDFKSYKGFYYQIVPQCGNIPINSLNYELLTKSGILPENLALEIYNYRIKNNFIYSIKEIEPVLKLEEYNYLKENLNDITFYSLFNVKLIDEYTFAKLYVEVTGYIKEYENAADYYIFNKNNINTKNISLKGSEKLKKYLVDYGFLDIYLLKNEIIEKILKFYHFEDEKVENILNLKSTKSYNENNLNFLNNSEKKIIKNLFITYSPFMEILIYGKDKKVLKNFIIYKIIESGKLKYIEIIK